MVAACGSYMVYGCVQVVVVAYCVSSCVWMCNVVSYSCELGFHIGWLHTVVVVSSGGCLCVPRVLCVVSCGVLWVTCVLFQMAVCC